MPLFGEILGVLCLCLNYLCRLLFCPARLFLSIFPWGRRSCGLSRPPANASNGIKLYTHQVFMNSEVSRSVLDKLSCCFLSRSSLSYRRRSNWLLRSVTGSLKSEQSVHSIYKAVRG
ncbi:hypothetical protein B0H12DRAFT_1134129 [Mycena haematopus]|nr:hypothetical protein B0H12DRAFT_1134129 [Mycena haematopus]